MRFPFSSSRGRHVHRARIGRTLARVVAVGVMTTGLGQLQVGPVLATPVTALDYVTDSGNLTSNQLAAVNAAIGDVKPSSATYMGRHVHYADGYIAVLDLMHFEDGAVSRVYGGRANGFTLLNLPQLVESVGEVSDGTLTVTTTTGLMSTTTASPATQRDSCANACAAGQVTAAGSQAAFCGGAITGGPPGWTACAGLVIATESIVVFKCMSCAGDTADPGPACQIYSSTVASTGSSGSTRTEVVCTKIMDYITVTDYAYINGPSGQVTSGQQTNTCSYADGCYAGHYYSGVTQGYCVGNRGSFSARWTRPTTHEIKSYGGSSPPSDQVCGTAGVAGNLILPLLGGI